MSIEEDLRRALEAGEVHAGALLDAREKAVASLRALERQLVTALAGENLKGLPVLFEPAGGAPPFRGLRARGKPYVALETGRGVLVLAASGRFVMVHATADGEVATRDASDADLRAEDVSTLPRVAEEAIRFALRIHVATLGKSTERYRALEALADRLLSVLS